jgi:hypothetical protein
MRLQFQAGIHEKLAQRDLIAPRASKLAEISEVLCAGEMVDSRGQGLSRGQRRPSARQARWKL